MKTHETIHGTVIDLENDETVTFIKRCINCDALFNGNDSLFLNEEIPWCPKCFSTFLNVFKFFAEHDRQSIIDVLYECMSPEQLRDIFSYIDAEIKNNS